MLQSYSITVLVPKAMVKCSHHLALALKTSVPILTSNAMVVEHVDIMDQLLVSGLQLSTSKINSGNHHKTHSKAKI